MPPREEIEQVIDAGIWAASGKGKQAPIVVAITEKGLRDQISSMNARIMPLIEPLEYREQRLVRDFVIVIDTSGSVDGAAVQKFVDTTLDVLTSEGAFCDRVNVHVIQADAAVQQDTVIRSMDDRPSKIATAIRISRRTLRIARENIVFAIAVKVAVLALAAVGLVPMFKVEAIVREEALEDVKQALFDIDVRGITVSQVMFPRSPTGQPREA